MTISLHSWEVQWIGQQTEMKETLVQITVRSVLNKGVTGSIIWVFNEDLKILGLYKCHEWVKMGLIMNKV